VAIGVGLTVLGASQLACYDLYANAREGLRQELRASMSRRVATIAMSVDGEAHGRFKSREQESTDAYRKALKPLARFQRANDDVIYVYTYVVRNGQTYFVLDPSPGGDSNRDGVEDKAHIMQPYDAATLAMRRAATEGTVQVDDVPYRDEWGTFFSAYAPFFDAKGKVAGAVGLDLSFATYQNRLGQARAAYFQTLAISVILAVGVGFAAYRLFRWIAFSAHRVALSELIDAQRDVLECAVQATDLVGTVALLCQRVEALCPNGRAVILVSTAVGPRVLAGDLPEGWGFTPPTSEGPIPAPEGTSAWAVPIARETEAGPAPWLIYFESGAEGIRPRDRKTLTAMAHVASLAFREADARAAVINARDRALITARTKSEFLSNMSHEIRTPMNGIIGMADLLQEMPLQPDQKECVDTIATNSSALLVLIDDILHLAKLEAGKVALESVPFDVTGYIANLVRPFEAAAEARGVEIDIYLDTPYGHILTGDPARIGQILTHLLSNAVKFTETGRIELEVSARPDRMRIVVRDTGCGIPEERLSSIFDPFTQADGSSTRRLGGTGLGLTICHRLVTLMDGTIEVETEVGKGSAFTVDVPFRSAA
jgi:signal transduction histidine kinase